MPYGPVGYHWHTRSPARSTHPPGYRGSTIASRIAPASVLPRKIYAPGPFLVSNHYADVAANGARMDAVDAHHGEAIGSPRDDVCIASPPATAKLLVQKLGRRGVNAGALSGCTVGRGAPLSSDGNEATAHGQPDRQQASQSRSWGSRLTDDWTDPSPTTAQHFSHDDGHACNTTFLPPTMTARLEQLEGSSKPVNDPALRRTVPKAPTPSPTRTRRRRRPPSTTSITDIMLTEERIFIRFNYNCHAMKEWKQIQQKKMVMCEATIMNTARLQVGNNYAGRYVYETGLSRPAHDEMCKGP
ncbi:hypothetical protein JB92DRAFT_3101950 [Gautieria morchelliformis]|nr:hypothetical protein JB92DRAFT_3101950 [Gautieria morchelliformis]